MRGKLEQRIGALAENVSEVLPPLLQVYDIEGSQGSSIDREAYRSRLLEAVRVLVQALADRGPLVVCLQDLHWADPSTVDLLRQLAGGVSGSVLTLVNYRPEFAFHEGGIREIRLTDLSDRDTRDLVESLLGASNVPDELVAFLEQRTGGNPFFVEEIVNGLIENRVLARNGDGWSLTRQFDVTSVPTTIRGVIAARIDRLDAERRRILQEASVIGREFLFTILSQVSGGEAALEDGLSALESADLIRKRDVDADLEYLFKHALTQEVAYSGLLRSKRHELHGRVAQAMEKLLGERSREYAESIAYHFQNSDAPDHATPYLLIAGKKAIERYALAEAATHYRAAYDILLAQSPSARRDHDLLELIVEWSLLHYYTGDINAFKQLMQDHAALLDSVPAPELRGMWLVWHAFVSYTTMEFAQSFSFADRAIAIADECGSARVRAYALTQKTWALLLFGRSGEAAATGEQALALVERLADERDATYIRLKAGAGASLARVGIGDLIKARALAKDLLDFAGRSGSRRALSMGHYATGVIHALTGDRTRGIGEMKLAIEAEPDPIYSAVVEVNLAANLMNDGQIEAARGMAELSLRSGEAHGLGFQVFMQRGNLALIALADGDLTRGMAQLEAQQREAERLDWPLMMVLSPLTIASVYAGIATGEGQGSGGKLGTILRNPGFVLGRARHASEIARKSLMQLSQGLVPDLEGYRAAIEFPLTRVLARRKERDEARKHIERAIAFLQPLGDSVGMRDARALLATLNQK